LKNNINEITFCFVQEGTRGGSEDFKKDCHVNCFDFSSFLYFYVRHGWKNHSRFKM